MMNFGDIFLYNEQKYIYLGLKKDAIYAARIIGGDEDKVDYLKNMRDQRSSQSNSSEYDLPLYCFCRT